MHWYVTPRVKKHAVTHLDITPICCGFREFGVQRELKLRCFECSRGGDSELPFIKDDVLNWGDGISNLAKEIADS